MPWAAAGSNVTLYLTAVDTVNLNIGSVLCPPGDLVPLATHFIARIIVFDIQVPITAGASVIVFDTKHFHFSLTVNSWKSFIILAIFQPIW